MHPIFKEICDNFIMIPRKQLIYNGKECVQLDEYLLELLKTEDTETPEELPQDKE